MAKVPYIPLYIGDWEQDTNCLTPLAEFALLKLTFKLFKSENKGVFITNFRTLSVLFKSNISETKEIFQELIDNNILDIQLIEDDKIEIKSRRMIREANLSLIRSETGSKGGRGHKANKKLNKSKVKPKGEQNTEYEYDNDIDIIVEYLNKKTSKNFSSKTKTTISNIKSRFRDGYQVSDFEKVIDIKTDQWLNDQKMVGYLNPETLFGNKFDKYLNEVPKPKLNLDGSTLAPMSDEEIENFIRPRQAV